MAGAIEVVVESLKKCLDLRLLLHYLAGLILNAIAFLLVVLVLAIPAGLVLLVFFNSNLALAIALLLAIVIVGFVLLVYINAIFQGLYIFLAKSFIETGKLSINEAFSNALPRANSLFAIQVVLMAFFLALFVVLMLPAIFPLLGVLSSLSPTVLLNPQSLVSVFLPVLLIAIIMILLFALIAFLLSPFTLLVYPVIVLENVSFLSGIKKAIGTAKQTYLQNLVAVVFFALITIAISIVFSIPNFLQGSSGVGTSYSPSFILLGISFTIIVFVFSVLQSLILTSFSSIFAVNYYKFNFGGFFPSETRKQIKQEMEKFMPSESETKEVRLEPWMGKRI